MSEQHAPTLTDHPGGQFSVSITIDRQAKQFVPTTKISAHWNNHGAPSDDLSGSNFMVPLGNDTGDDPGETMRLNAVLDELIQISQEATHRAMIIAQAYEAQRPEEVIALLTMLNQPNTPDELRANLESAIATAAMIATTIKPEAS